MLLIEDDLGTAENIKVYFQDCGYDVQHAATGSAGLASARGGLDAPIIDRLLPELDGLSIIEALRGSGVRTPALVLSALGGVDGPARGLRAGGDDYLAKPFALTELATRIEALPRRPQHGPETVLRVGPLELDLVARTARRTRARSVAARVSAIGVPDAPAGTS